MRLLLSLPCFACVLALTAPGHAGIVHLDDGSRIQGEIVGFDSAGLTVETSFAGKLVIAAETIAGLDSDKQRTVTLADGGRVTGRLRYRADSGRQVLETAPSRVRSLDMAAVRKIDPLGESLPAVAEADAADSADAADTVDTGGGADRQDSGERWSASSEFGLTGASGNTDRINLNGKATARRESEVDRLNLSVQARFAREDGAETENEIIGRSRYERDFSPRWFAFGGLELERDEFEDLDLRSVLTAGTGVFLIKREAQELKARGGFGYQREAFMSSSTEDEGVLSLGYDYTVALNAWLLFTHSFTILPSLRDPADDFRIESDANLDIPVSDDKAWRIRLGLRNHFDNQPAPGNEELDTFYTVSLAYDFM